MSLIDDRGHMEEPTNVEKIAATLLVMKKKAEGKTIGKEHETSKKNINNKMDVRTKIIAGALAIVLTIGVGSRLSQNKKLDNQIRETVQTEFYENDAFKYINKQGNAVELNVRDDGTVYYPNVNNTTVEVPEIKDKKIVVNTDNERRYQNIMGDKTSPFSDVGNAYAREVTSAARNSGLDEKEELGKFYQANYPDFDPNYLIETFYSINAEPTRPDKKEIQQKGVEAVYGNGGNSVIVEGGQYENNSVRR